MPSLDVRDVFNEYTPKYESKYYLEGEKLFYKIAPSFNMDGDEDLTDIDYLLRFINAANQALRGELNLENTAEGIVCDYFVKSVENKMLEKAMSK